MRRFVPASLAAAIALTGLTTAVAYAAPAPAMGNLLVSASTQGVTLTGLSTLPAAGIIVTRSGQTTTITTLEEFTSPIFQPGANCLFAPGGGVNCTTSSTAVIADFRSTTAGVEVDIQEGSGLNATFTGGSGNDSFYGANGTDTASGGSGDDDLFGGPSNDILSGETGNDHVEGEEGDDQLSAGTGNDDLVSAEDPAQQDQRVECGDASGSDTLDIDPMLDITKNCQGVGTPALASPASVTASGTINASGNAIVNASWTNIARASAYQIDVSSDSGLTWRSITRVATSPFSGWNAGSLRGTIVLRVSAVNASAVSSGVQSNTVTLGSSPATPANLRAQAWVDEDIVETGIHISWTSATAPKSFDVQYRGCTGSAATDTCGAWTSASVNGASTSAHYTVPTPGFYNVRVRGVGDTGLTSDWATTDVSVPTGQVTTPTSVNAWASATQFRVLWTSSGLPAKWLKGYRIQMQYNDPNGNVSAWVDVKQTSGTSTTTVLSSKTLGTNPRDIVRFRVFTVPVYGADSRASSPSPRRQQTDSVPTPGDFAATYDPVTDYLTMTWTNPPLTTLGGANVGGYNFAYMWPGTTTWTQLGSPLSYDSERAVFSLVNVPRGTFKVRIQSIGWPDSLYSEWTVTKSVRK